MAYSVFASMILAIITSPCNIKTLWFRLNPSKRERASEREEKNQQAFLNPANDVLLSMATPNLLACLPNSSTSVCICNLTLPSSSSAMAILLFVILALVEREKKEAAPCRPFFNCRSESSISFCRINKAVYLLSVCKRISPVSWYDSTQAKGKRNAYLRITLSTTFSTHSLLMASPTPRPTRWIYMSKSFKILWTKKLGSRSTPGRRVDARAWFAMDLTCLRGSRARAVRMERIWEDSWGINEANDDSDRASVSKISLQRQRGRDQIEQEQGYPRGMLMMTRCQWQRYLLRTHPIRDMIVSDFEIEQWWLVAF